MTRPPRSEWKPIPANPRQSVRSMVDDFCQALLINDGAAARRIGKKLNTVGVSPQQRRVELERWHEQHPGQLDAWFEAYHQSLEAATPVQQYLPTRQWSLNEQLAEIARAANDKWWQRL